MACRLEPMPSLRAHRLVVLGADRVGKTALIEQLIFGNHVLSQVSFLKSGVGLVSQTRVRDGFKFNIDPPVDFVLTISL